MAKVLHGFIDGITNQYYKIGSDYQGELAEKLISLGYIEGTKPSVDLAKLTVKELKNKADELGLEYKDNAKKADLIALIKE